MINRWMTVCFVLMFSCSLALAQDEDAESSAPEAPAQEEKAPAPDKKTAAIIVTDVQVDEDASGDFKGIASITINGVLKIKDIKIDKTGALKYPAYVSKSGREYFQFEPVTNQAKQEIERAIKTKTASETVSKSISYKIVEYKALNSKSRKANAKISINNSVEISCGVLIGKKGPWVAWPAVRDEASGKYQKQVIFVNKKLQDTIEKALIGKYEASKTEDAQDEE